MIIRHKNNKSPLLGSRALQIDNVNIDTGSQIKYLGCIIDNNLTFSEHYKYITNKIAKKTNVLARVSKELSIWARLTAYKTIIAPHLYFCSTLLFLMNNSEIDVLQKKQNKALRTIIGCNKFTSRLDMLKSTNLLSVRQTVTHNTMVFIYKMLNDLLPKHLLNNCTFVRDIHNHNTRSRNNFYLNMSNTNYSKTCGTLSQFKRKCIEYVKQTIAL